MATNGIIGKMQAAGGLHLLTSTLYGTCETAAGTAEKIVYIADTGTNTMTLITGMTLSVKFTYANTAANPTLAIRSNGNAGLQAAIPIMRYGTTVPGTNAAGSWQAGSVVAFVYDGTNWQMVGWLNNNDNTLLRTYKAYNTDIELPLIGGSTGSTTPAAPTGETSYASLYGQIPKVTANRATYNLSTGAITVPGGLIGNLTGNADSADTANITSTKYGVSYYTNNTGTFASTAAGTVGQVFASGGANAAPSWKTLATTSIGSASAGTAISADDITAWSAGTMFSAAYDATNERLTLTSGTAPSLSYTSRSIPNISVTSKTVATGSVS